MSSSFTRYFHFLSSLFFSLPSSYFFNCLPFFHCYHHLRHLSSLLTIQPPSLLTLLPYFAVLLPTSPFPIPLFSLLSSLFSLLLHFCLFLLSSSLTALAHHPLFTTSHPPLSAHHFSRLPLPSTLATTQPSTCSSLLVYRKAIFWAKLSSFSTPRSNLYTSHSLSLFIKLIQIPHHPPPTIHTNTSFDNINPTTT